MRCVQLFAPRDLRVMETCRPTPALGDVLLRVEAVGVCGSDLHYYEEGRIGNTRLTEPFILGHEFAGIVESATTPSGERLIGTRVAVEPGRSCGVCEHCLTGNYNVCAAMAFPGGPGCDGALCEYTVVPARMCFSVPNSMRADEAAAIEPLAVALHSIDLAGLRPGESVAVLGLGPIGLMTGLAARTAGAGKIYGTDLHEYRVRVAARLFAHHAVNVSESETVEAILGVTGGRGVDVAFDCARSPDTLGLACKITRPGGRCILTGISGNEDDSLPVTEARRKGLDLRWCRRFRHNYPRAIALASPDKIDLRPLLTHQFPLEQAQAAFEMVSNARDGVLKATITPG